LQSVIHKKEESNADLQKQIGHIQMELIMKRGVEQKIEEA
jgi:hypothetical protein